MRRAAPILTALLLMGGAASASDYVFLEIDRAEMLRGPFALSDGTVGYVLPEVADGPLTSGPALFFACTGSSSAVDLADAAPTLESCDPKTRWGELAVPLPLEAVVEIAEAGKIAPDAFVSGWIEDTELMLNAQALDALAGLLGLQARGWVTELLWLGDLWPETANTAWLLVYP